MGLRVSGVGSAAELDDGEFAYSIVRCFGKGSKWAWDVVEMSNSSISILLHADIVIEVSATSTSMCTQVLIECNDDEEVDDVKDDDDKRNNPGLRLSELLLSCSGSVPESSL